LITVPFEDIEFGLTCCEVPLPLKTSAVEGLTKPEPLTTIIPPSGAEVGLIEVIVGADMFCEPLEAEHVQLTGQVTVVGIVGVVGTAGVIGDGFDVELVNDEHVYPVGQTNVVGVVFIGVQVKPAGH
jgi:hypothetical protein